MDDHDRVDLGRLCYSKPTSIAFNCDTVGEDIAQITKEGVQKIVNAVWQLPTRSVGHVVVADLPPPYAILPREKPLPKMRALTKWEEFKRERGLQSRRKNRTKMVWDDSAKEWRPRYGYKRTNDNTKDWLIEVPANADPMEDQFAVRRDAKKERIAKNEYQRLRNIARTQKHNLVKVTSESGGKKVAGGDLKRAANIAHLATASMGKFDERVKHEKVSRHAGKRRKVPISVSSMISYVEQFVGQERDNEHDGIARRDLLAHHQLHPTKRFFSQQFDSNFGPIEAEKDRSLAVFNSLLSKKAKLNTEHIASIQQGQKTGKAQSKSEKDSLSSGKGKSAVPIRSGKSSKPPPSKDSKKPLSSGKVTKASKKMLKHKKNFKGQKHGAKKGKPGKH